MPSQIQLIHWIFLKIGGWLTEESSKHSSKCSLQLNCLKKQNGNEPNLRQTLS
uniref:Uncharacterized protein n=1 Tax=Anguilla anguilla TaxID=7936 RepID=A0A0E9WC55_ANGAN